MVIRVGDLFPSFPEVVVVVVVLVLVLVLVLVVVRR